MTQNKSNERPTARELQLYHDALTDFQNVNRILSSRDLDQAGKTALRRANELANLYKDINESQELSGHIAILRECKNDLLPYLQPDELRLHSRTLLSNRKDLSDDEQLYYTILDDLNLAFHLSTEPEDKQDLQENKELLELYNQIKEDVPEYMNMLHDLRKNILPKLTEIAGDSIRLSGDERKYLDLRSVVEFGISKLASYKVSPGKINDYRHLLNDNFALSESIESLKELNVELVIQLEKFNDHSMSGTINDEQRANFKTETTNPDSDFKGKKIYQDRLNELKKNIGKYPQLKQNLDMFLENKNQYTDLEFNELLLEMERDIASSLEERSHTKPETVSFDKDRKNEYEAHLAQINILIAKLEEEIKNYDDSNDVNLDDVHEQEEDFDLGDLDDPENLQRLLDGLDDNVDIYADEVAQSLKDFINGKQDVNFHGMLNDLKDNLNNLKLLKEGLIAKINAIDAGEVYTTALMNLENKILQLAREDVYQQSCGLAVQAMESIQSMQEKKAFYGLSNDELAVGLVAIHAVLDAQELAYLKPTIENQDALLTAMEELEKFEKSVSSNARLQRVIKGVIIAATALVIVGALVGGYLALSVLFPPAAVLPLVLPAILTAMGMAVPGTAGLLTVSSLGVNAVAGAASYFILKTGFNQLVNPEQAYSSALANLRLTVDAIDKNDYPVSTYNRLKASLGLKTDEKPGQDVVDATKELMNEIRAIKLSGENTESLESLTRGLNVLNNYLKNPTSPAALKAMDNFTTTQPPDSPLYTAFTKVILPVIEMTLVTGLLIYAAGFVTPFPLNVPLQALGSSLLSSGVAAWTIPFLPGGPILPDMLVDKAAGLAAMRVSEALVSNEKKPEFSLDELKAEGLALVSKEHSNESGPNIVSRFKKELQQLKTTVQESEDLNVSPEDSPQKPDFNRDSSR